jgi:hypothetical protein
VLYWTTVAIGSNMQSTGRELSMNSRTLRAAFGVAVFGAFVGTYVNNAAAAVEISNKPTRNMSCSGGVCSPTAKNAVLNVNDLTGMLANGDVSVASGSLANDIDIKTAFSWTNAQKLTLDSYNSILFQAAVVVAGTGALTIVTNVGGGNGDFRFASKGRVEFWDTASKLTINGNQYILIANFKQFVSQERRGGNSSRYALAKNLDIGKRVYEATPMKRTFGGSFEGLGNTISNLTLTGTIADENVGLFGEYLPSGGVVRDLHLKSVNVTATASGQNVGAVAGMMSSGSVVNVDVSGTVSASGANSIVGGVVGLSIIGTIRGDTSEATVSGTNAVAVGGLIGEDQDGCPRCGGTLDSNYATGSVTGGDSTAVGGLFGESLGTELSNSYATGAVSGGNGASVGGLVGINGGSEFSGVPLIWSSYSTGLVSGGSGASVGGFVGQDQGTSSMTQVYWDLDTSGVSDASRGAGNVASDPGITGLTTSQLTSALPAGFDPSVWGQSPRTNGGYPYLLAVPFQ